MRSGVLARGRASVRGLTLTAGACAALTAGLAGCAAATSSSVTIVGKTLTIYVSLPAQAPVGLPAQDVLAAEQLAFQQKQSEVSNFKLKLVPLHGSKLSDNARTAIEDTNAIAYLGEIVPGASSDSIGITNARDLLQVGPTDTALELTLPSAAVPRAPNRYYESLKTYGRTFARVVPNTAHEAKAQVQEMQAVGVKKLYVADDGSQYGAAIAFAVKQDAPSSITVVRGPATAAKFQASGADALFFGVSPGASSKAAAASLFGDAAKANPGAKLFGPSALDDSAFAASFGPAKLNLYVSAPGFLPNDLAPAGRQFVKDFQAAYRRPPATGAIFGYDAMAAVLDVLHQAGSLANDRSAVVRGFFAIKNRTSVLGTYSIDGNGDTTLAPFVISRLMAGKLVPFAPAQG